MQAAISPRTEDHTAAEKQKILVVDDEKDVRVFISEVATGMGYEVHTASDTDTFKRAYRAHLPGRIILDLQLNGCDGIEFIRYLASEKCASEVILVSGADRRTLTSARRIGEQYGLKMGEVIEKPLTIESLEGSINKKPAAIANFKKADILAALAGEQMTAFFQPQIASHKDGGWSVGGVEALARWNHPQFGLVMPDKFIHCAEESGIIAPLTDYILQKSLHYVKQWEDEGVKLSVAINISGAMLSDLSLPDRIEARVKKAGVSPSQIILEVTESAVMNDINGANDILTRLRLKGFELSLDDFGTGYSSMVQLYRLPFSELKIDRSFVMDMHANKEAHVIVRALIDLAHNLGLEVCAEGVEDKKTFDELINLGCEKMQGYYFSRPVSSENVLPMVKQFNSQRSTRKAGL
ncbi:MAG: EAL domain-containing response regulator [Alphaproteobacteria bacterium]|nr:EAL domain-containing response regulator [Alphaproteobacteria bacterium]